MNDAGPEALVIAAEEPTHPDAALLIGRLSAELGAIYGDDGAGGFAADDVRAPGGAFLVARLEERAVGCGALRPWAEGVAEVKRMYVEPGLRGRGVGRRLLAALEAQARALGYQRVRLETGVQQPEAVRLYDAAGYARIECYGRHAGDPRSVCFEKALA